MEGQVKWFNKDKGFGFITPDSGQDHYFNVRSVVGAELPTEGDIVSFESKSGNKGPRALEVKIIKKNSQQSRDDRINCPACKKKIVPRMITYRGNPQKSVCPYCAATVKEFSKCFIATAVYGDPCASEVISFREFRDNKLNKNIYGKTFIKLYYKLSPPVANFLKDHKSISRVVRMMLDFILRRFIVTKG